MLFKSVTCTRVYVEGRNPPSNSAPSSLYILLVLGIFGVVVLMLLLLLLLLLLFKASLLSSHLHSTKQRGSSSHSLLSFFHRVRRMG